MKHVRLGIVGLGVIGQSHARTILEGKIPRLRLAAVADQDPARLAKFGIAATAIAAVVAVVVLIGRRPAEVASDSPAPAPQ